MTDQPASYLVTPAVLDLFVRALVNEVDYDIHKNYLCNEEDGLDHYPELVAEAAEMLAAITAAQPAPKISANVAAHVLWSENRGGYEPGSFTKKLLAAWPWADDANAARLEAEWPEYAAAFRLLGQRNGIEQLRDIAGDH